MYNRVKKVEDFPKNIKSKIKELRFNGVDLIVKLRNLFSSFNDQVEEIRKDAEDLNIAKLDQVENTDKKEVYKTNPQDREEFEQTITIDKGEHKSLINKFSLGNIDSTEHYTEDNYNKLISVIGNNIETSVNTELISELKSLGLASEETKVTGSDYNKTVKIGRHSEKLEKLDSASFREVTTIGNLQIADIIEEDSTKRKARVGDLEKMDILLGESQVSTVTSSGKVLQKVSVNLEEVIYTGNPLSGDKDIADKSFTKQYGVVFKQPMLSYLDANYHKIKDFNTYKKSQDTVNSNTTSELAGIKTRLTQIEERLTLLEKE